MPPRRRSNVIATPTLIGDCGHVCLRWPAIGRGRGVVEVICETCTRAKYGIPDEPKIGVWARVDEPVWVTAKTTPSEKTLQDLMAEQPAAAKPKPKKAPKAKPPPKPNKWEQLLMDNTDDGNAP